MSLESYIVLTVILTTSLLLMSGRFAPDLIAVSSLMALTLVGPLTTSDAFFGYGSSTVVMIVASFFFAAALKRLGIAQLLGEKLVELTGNQERRLVVAVVLLGTAVSSIMNNVSAVALLLPSVVTVAAHCRTSPSLLYLPLSFGAVMGGTLTLIGTPPNLVADEILVSSGFQGLSMTSITPFGIAMVGVGAILIGWIYKRALPSVEDAPDLDRRDLPAFYRVRDRVCSVRVPLGSGLVGKTLAQTRFGELLGAEIVGIDRNGKRVLAPDPEEVLRPNDVLVVMADRDEVAALVKLRAVKVLGISSALVEHLGSFLQISVLPVDSTLLNAGDNLSGLKFKDRVGGMVIAIERGSVVLTHHLARQELVDGDRLLIASPLKEGEAGSKSDSAEDVTGQHRRALSRLNTATLPSDSSLAGMTLRQSRLGELAGVEILAIVRPSETIVLPGPEEILQESDQLVIAGDANKLAWIAELSELEIAVGGIANDLESSSVGLVEAIVPPQSKLVAKTLAEVDFREKYDFQVIAIWRSGRSFFHRLGGFKLALGDALLLQGPRHKVSVLSKNRDFIILANESSTPLSVWSVSMLVIAATLLLLGSLSHVVPPHIAMVLAVLVLVISGIVSMEEGCREVDWRVVLFVGALLPFHLAISRTDFFPIAGEALVSFLGNHSAWFAIALLVLLASLIAQLIEGTVAALLVVPLAIQVAPAVGVDVRLMALAVAAGASVAFLTPTSHRAHLLVMSAGGYSARDVVRLGLPVTLGAVAAILMVAEVAHLLIQWR